MFCKYCGKEILDDSVYCSHCGSKIEETTPTTAALQPTPEPEPKKISVLCLVGFILSCFSWILDFFCLISLSGFIVSLLGTIRANKEGDKLKGLGIAGIPVGIAAFIINLILIISKL